MDAKCREEHRNSVYKAYITEAIRNISESVAKGMGQGSYMSKSYMDIIDPKPEPTETADDIINRISTKLEKINGFI